MSLSMTIDSADRCSDCGGSLHADDETCPETQRELETIRLFGDELRPLIDRASKSDETADLHGETGVALLALSDALQQALDVVKIRQNHDHQWNDNDYCRVCGADGRA